MYSYLVRSRITGTTATTTTTSMTQLSSERKGFGPSIPAFRFSDNIMGAQKPRDSRNPINDSTENRDMNNMNANHNNYSGDSNGINAAVPLQQSPPPQQQLFTPEPMNNMNTKKVAPALSYLEQLQQQQQSPSSPPPPNAAVEQPPKQPQQPVVYNDFSEYERQLRQFTQGH